VRPLHVASDVHGASGLEGADLPEPAFDPRPEGAVELIRSVLRAAAEPVTIAAVGPLTNVALLLRSYPELAERIAGIRIMGGAIGEGNTTASAEFNIWQDPEAARIVLECGRPLTLMPLDVTHQALFGPGEVARLDALGTRLGSVVADLLRYFARFHAERYGWDGSPIHDAVTVAHLAVPDLVRTIAYRVDVETVSELTRGRTVVDLHGLTGLPPNVEVGVAIDRPRFVDLLVNAVATVGAR
jgi:inosine-uridine nucleoside N-ribohydrolase